MFNGDGRGVVTSEFAKIVNRVDQVVRDPADRLAERSVDVDGKGVSPCCRSHRRVRDDRQRSGLPRRLKLQVGGGYLLRRTTW